MRNLIASALFLFAVACAREEAKPEKGTLGTVDLSAPPPEMPRPIQSLATVTPSVSAPMLAPGGSAKPIASATAVIDAGAAPGGGSTNPLYDYMKKVVSPAARADDSTPLVSVYEKIATFAPPGYTNWASISNDGKNAAKAGNKDAAQAACRSCHEQYKAKYKAELRTRPL